MHLFARLIELLFLVPRRPGMPRKSNELGKKIESGVLAQEKPLLSAFHSTPNGYMILRIKPTAN